MLDVYRAANFLLRGALAGRPGLVLAFLPPDEGDGDDGDGGSGSDVEGGGGGSGSGE